MTRPVPDASHTGPGMRVDLLRVAALLAFETAVVVALQRLGQVPVLAIDVASPGRWLATTDPVDAVVAAVRVVALVLSCWSLASTLAYLLARLWGAPAAIRVAARVTLPAIRRYIGRAVTVYVVTGSLTAPLPGLAQPPPPVTVEGEVPNEHPPDARPGPRDRHVVEVGDSLWTIARDALATAPRGEDDHARGTEHRHERDTASTAPDVPTVATYWIRVIEENRAHLRSGDPDLIHPGETIRLPPTG